ncbi:MAG TPA: S1C family serine protease [Baekduia sp.]|nr:S1C family serine protease [Baekduia sp.]
MSTESDLAQRLGPSVVGLTAGSRGGSGVIVAPGVAVTLARQLADGDEVGLRLGDGRDVRARVLGRDATVDVAVLAFDGTDLPEASWAEPVSAPEIGTRVFALADPAGRGLRVTAGAIATAPRAVRGPAGRIIDGVLEHTAPMARGSGGGPLVDADGAIVGLNARRQGEGLVLAWPTAAVRGIAEALAAGRRTAPPLLGVALAGPRQTRRLRAAVGLPDVGGLLVRDVVSDSPAARAGILRGDLLVAAGDTPLAALDALYAAVDAARRAPVALDVVRGTDALSLSIDLTTEEPS